MVADKEHIVKRSNRVMLERRIKAVKEWLIVGYGRSWIYKKSKARWDITPRQTRKYIERAEQQLIEDYQRDFVLDLHSQLSLEQKHYIQLQRALNSNEKRVKITRNAQGGIESREQSVKEFKGRGSIFTEIGRTLERISKLKGLHRPDLFDRMSTDEEPEPPKFILNFPVPEHSIMDQLGGETSHGST